MSGGRVGQVVELTVDPRVRYDNSTLGQLQLGKLSFDALIFHHDLLDDNKFLSIAGSVDERAEASIALDLAGGQVDDSLVKFVLWQF